MLLPMIWACTSGEQFDFGGQKKEKESSNSDTAMVISEPSEENSEEEEVNPFECPTTTEKPELSTNTFLEMGKPPGGWITRITQHPSDTDLIWVGSQMNGLYRSLNGGESFEDMTSLISSHVFSDVVVNPNDPNWVGYSNDSLFFSENQGQTWNRFEGFPNGIVSVQSLLWYGDQLLIAGYRPPYIELFSTTDLDSSSLLYSLMVEVGEPAAPPHSDHGSSLSSGSKSYEIRLHKSGESIFLVRKSTEILRSDNGGVDFSIVFQSSNEDEDAIINYFLATDTALSGSKLALCVYDAVNHVSSIYSSEDNGDTWIEHGNVSGQFVSFSRYDQYISILTNEGVVIQDLNNDEQFLVGEAEQFSEEPLVVQYVQDGSLMVGDIRGVSKYKEEIWTQNYDDFVDLDIVTLGSIASCPGLVFAGTLCEMGGFVSTDWGQHWELIDNYFHYVMRIEERPTQEGEIWAISDDQVFKSVTYGRNWTKMMPSNMEYHYHAIALSPWNDDEVLIGSVGSGPWSDDSGKVYRSEDGGITWSESSQGLPDNNDSVHVLHYVHQDSYQNVVLLGSYLGGIDHSSFEDAFGLYRSEDGGVSWQEVLLDGESFSNIPEIAECNDRIYIATEKGLYLSDDGGSSFEFGGNNTSRVQIVSVDCYKDIVFYMDERGNILRSVDQGNTWNSVHNGWPISERYHQNKIHIDPNGEMVWLSNRGQGIYALGL